MKTKLVYIIGAIVIGLASTLAIIFGLVGGDVIDVEKTTIIVESASDVAIYDGTEHTCNQYEISSGELKEGHTAKVTVYGSQTTVGCSLNYMSVTIYDENNVDVTDYYVIEKKLGTLTVDKAPLVLTSKSKEKQYDGQELDCDYYDIGEQSQLAAGHKIVADFTQSILYVGTIQNTFSAKVVDETGADVTSNYDITRQFGLLTVNPRNITIKSASNSKIYDGTPLEDDGFTIAKDAIVEGNYLNYTNDTSITNVGIIDNDFVCQIVDKNNVDVTSNYEITYVKGKLQVGVKNITISSNSISEVYNGQPIICESYEIEEDAICDGDSLTVSYLNSRIEAGTTPNEFSWVMVDEDGNDVTANYIVNKVVGSIVVTPRDITFRSATKDKIYDGTPLENEEGDLTIEEGTLVENQTVNYRAFTSITTAQENVPNAISPIILDADGNNVSSNYNITSIEGTFTINKRPITLTSTGDSKNYDGAVLEYSKVEISGDAAPNQTITASSNGSIKYVGSITNAITYTITAVIDEEITDVSPNYDVTLNEGLLEITKRPLNISSDSDNKVYDGSPLTKETYSLGSTTVATTDVLDVSFTKSLTNAGTCSNEFTYTILDENGDDMSDNYEIAPLAGTLTITQRPLIIHTDSLSSQYTGQPLTKPGLDYLSTSLAPTDTLFINSSDPSITNVGKIDNSYEYEIRNSITGENTIENYAITEQFGELEVTQVTLKVTIDSDSKVYDGIPLTKNTSTITSGNLVLDHVLTYNMTSDSTITNVGTVANKVEENSTYIYDGSYNDVTENYNVIYTSGELTVTPRDLTIRSNDKTAEYAGSPLTCDEFTITYGSISEKDYIVVTIDGSLDYIGNALNSFAAVKLYRKNESATNYLTIKDGEIVVINSLTLTNSYEIKLLGFNSTHTKYYVQATLDSNTYYGMVNATSFEAVSYYDEATDMDVTSCYNLTQNVGQLILVYSKETTGLTEEEEYEDEYEVLQVKAAQTGAIYLRSYSYTTYYGNTWSKGTEYTKLLDNKYSYNYLTSAKLADLGYTPTSAKIKLTNAPYVLPYYIVMNDSQDTIQTSDVLYSGTSSEYSVDYYSNTYSSIKGITPSTYEYSDEEAEYYEYVKSKYLQIPDTTKTFLLNLISNSSITTIDKAITYISNAATYNMSYDRDLDSEQDKVVAFLSEYKEGVCSHFAEACTLMLRAMGYPARYVSGYYAYGIKDEWVSITNMKRHAWTEVYLNGIGWVQIDATGASIVEDEEEADNTKKYSVKPEDCYYKASSVEDGENYILYSNNHLTGLGMKELLTKGYTYKEVKTVNYQIGFGTTYCSIDSFTLLDPNGYDVTEDFTFLYSSGKLQVYLQEFSVASNSLNTTYDGTAKSDTTIKINGVVPSDLTEAATLANLASGHYFAVLEITSSLTKTGEVQNYISYLIKDSNDIDVTSYYRVTENLGTITVSEREIELTAGSATQTYDKTNPTALTCSDYDITSTLKLAAGDTITSIEFSGSQLTPGSCSNEIVSVVIQNALGQDVTSCYKITTVSGTLTVNKPTT